MQTSNLKKIEELKTKLKIYKEKLAKEMIGYRGVVHESAESEIKHNTVMVLRDIINDLEIEIAQLQAAGKTKPLASTDQKR
jgi:uncharacterized radical SAM superfamily protein